MTDTTLSTITYHGIISKYVTVASYTMMTYDIILTFSIEIEKIWKQRFSGLTILWLLNRWVYLAGATIMVTEFLDPNWGPELCSKTYKYPGFLDMGQRLVVGAIFAIRIFCIYSRSILVTSIVIIFILAEFAIKIYTSALLTFPIILPAGQGGCFESTNEKNVERSLGFWITELTTDGAVLALTAYRVYTAYWKHRFLVKNSLWRVIFMDGIMYFLVVFSANLATVILYLTMPPELKVVAGPFGAYVTSTLVSRLILNLKVAGEKELNITSNTVVTTLGIHSRVEDFIFGNMRNDMEDVISTYDSSLASSQTAAVSEIVDGYELANVSKSED